MYDRLVPFDRILNFRDFGGWDTREGARVVRGRLFRSAAFNDATEADMAKLDGMDLRFLVDLRRPEERAHEPNRWANQACRMIFNDDGAGGPALPPHLLALMESDLTAESTRRYMLSLYREIPFDPRLISLYRDWFASLQEGGAGVVHCAAGKDRTGIICALTLLALGVDEDAVFADYDFTNQAVDLNARLPRIKARMEERLGKTLNADAIRPMMGVEIDYLREALDTIEARHGSVVTYMTDVLGVDSTVRATLRDKLAE